MQGDERARRGLRNPDHYLNIIDLYATRVSSSRVVPLKQTETPPITYIGRKPRPSFAVLASRDRSAGLLTGRRRVASVATVVVILLTIFAGTAFAGQKYRVQPGDTINSISLRFGVDAVAIAEANDLAGVEHLYPGQVLEIPGIADGELGTGFIAGTYEVKFGDTISSIAWDLHVGAADLLELNGLTADTIIYPGQVLIVPEESATKEETLEQLNLLDDSQISTEIESDQAEAEASGAASTSGLPASATIWVPTYYQQRNLSCEYASTSIATAAFGAQIPESSFWNSIPVTLNPHYGYRGNIDGWWGNTWDYGIYAEPLVPVLNANGFGADVFYGGGDPAELMQQLAWGRPVVVWLGTWGNTGVVYDDEGTYTVFSGMHVMTAFGYDEGGVHLSDPALGQYLYFDWGTFLWMWQVTDGMAMAVYPA